MEELAQPQPVLAARAETPEEELARLRQELQHYQDATLERQRQYAGVYATPFGPVDPFLDTFCVASIQQRAQAGLGQIQQALAQNQDMWATGTLIPLTPMDADTLARHRADEDAARARTQEAVTRALGLLEEKIGATAVANIQAGCGFAIVSRRWPNVVYLVPRDPNHRVKVLADGRLVTEVCIVSKDHSLPWPDIMLHRITAIEADESILFATGVVHPSQLRGWYARLARWFTNRE